MTAWTLVTGGAKRLGAEICRSLAKQGHAIVVHYQESVIEAEEVVASCREMGVAAESISGSFANLESTQAFLEEYLQRFPTTQNLINNVGNYYIASALQTPLDTWEELFQTNFYAPIAIIQALMPSLKEVEGSIVNIGIAGIDSWRADTYSTAYMMTKECLWMLTRSLAREVASDHVKVNMVSPGYLDFAVDVPQDLSRIPMGRTATAAEVARVVAFLLDIKSSYITGQNIEVAGGVRI